MLLSSRAAAALSTALPAATATGVGVDGEDAARQLGRAAIPQQGEHAAYVRAGQVAIVSARGVPPQGRVLVVDGHKDQQIVYTLPESSDGGRERLDFIDGEEPTDVIYEYGQMRNLTLRQRKLLLHEVCTEPRRRPNCTRAEPMLVKIPVWETQDKLMGNLEILEGQEPIDVVYAFLKKHDLFLTEPLNVTLFETVCNCTRPSFTQKLLRDLLLYP